MIPPIDESSDRPTATRKAAAAYLGKHVNTLWKWERLPCQRGLPCHTRANGEKFYYWEDLRRYKHGLPIKDIAA